MGPQLILHLEFDKFTSYHIGFYVQFVYAHEILRFCLEDVVTQDRASHAEPGVHQMLNLRHSMQPQRTRVIATDTFALMIIVSKSLQTPQD